MSEADVLGEVATASRILAMLAVVDAFGHVSRRHPGREGQFLMSRSLAPARVRAQDVLALDATGSSPDAPRARLFVERFIHSEIYRMRSEVGAIVHAHSPDVLPFTVVPSMTARPICHMCGFLADMPTPFDLAEHAGNASNLLISNAAFGTQLARHLGDGAVVLMRGHGFTAVGRDLPEAVFRAVYTVRNCQIQRASLALGNPVYLSAGEAAECDRTTASQIGRAWALWLDELDQHPLGKSA